MGGLGLLMIIMLFCKKKGLWKAQIPKLLKTNKENFKIPLFNVVAPTIIGSSSGHV